MIPFDPLPMNQYLVVVPPPGLLEIMSSLNKKTKKDEDSVVP
jgi:hypothetical protein